MGERTMVAYERGGRTPSDEAIRQLANVLGFPVEFFYRPAVSDQPDDEEGVSFRAMSRMTAAQRHSALASRDLALEFADWVESEFTIPEPDIPDLRPQPDPEFAAEALRGRWSLGDRPIANVIHLLESRGIRVFSLAEDCRELDAFSFWRNGKPYVFLNTMKSGERSRFDAAHELGHIVLHAHGSPQGREAEWEADQFAGAFLMPSTNLKAHAPRGTVTLDKLVAAKHYWGVSVAALAYRLHEIGMVTDWRYRGLCIEMQKKGFRTKEPDGCQRETSQILSKVFECLSDEGVHRSDVAAMFDWPTSELRALTFQLVASTGTESASIELDNNQHERSNLRVI